MNEMKMREYLDKREAAKLFGVCTRTIDNWRKRGLRAIKKGGIVRFKLADLRAFFEQERSSPAQRT